MRPLIAVIPAILAHRPLSYLPCIVALFRSVDTRTGMASPVSTLAPTFKCTVSSKGFADFGVAFDGEGEPILKCVTDLLCSALLLWSELLLNGLTPLQLDSLSVAERR